MPTRKWLWIHWRMFLTVGASSPSALGEIIQSAIIYRLEWPCGGNLTNMPHLNKGRSTPILSDLVVSTSGFRG